MKEQSFFRRISILCFIAMLIMFIVHVQLLVMFNRQELNVHGNSSGSKAYMEIDARANSTSKWLKRDFPLAEDRTVDLTGQTIDETLYNNSGDLIKDWGLRINIHGDCFINQTWTGDVEIHQFVQSGHEKVQRLDLQDYHLDEVTLEYRHDGDLLIPLEAGDYLIYYPNEHYTEMPVNNGDKVTIGMIFYYVDDLDLSDYDVTIHFHRGFAQGWSFIVFIVTVGLWILASVIHGTTVVTYRNAQKQMELRKSGLSSMSELYAAIYLINLPTGEMTPVSEGDYVEGLRAKYGSAKETLRAAVENDAADEYLDAVLAFIDTDTLPERLKDQNSVVIEFLSRQYGWCNFRFFAMDRNRSEENPLENVIFAVQDVNDERSEMKAMTDRLLKAEAVSTANTGFLSGASRGLQAPVQELLRLDDRLLRETDPEKVRETAEDIRGITERMLLLINGIKDRARMESGNAQPAAQPYSLKQVITDAFRAVRPAAEKKQIVPELEVSETIPDGLLGDAARLKETLASLLSHAFDLAGDGSVRLSVFGKVLEDSVHLLVSTRSIPAGGETAEQAAPRKPAGPDLDLEIAGSLLACMGSSLKSVRSEDAWHDMYFELEQKVADPAPIGRMTAEDTKR